MHHSLVKIIPFCNDPNVNNQVLYAAIDSHSLQELLFQSLHELPKNAPNQLKLGLTCTHGKLCDY